MKEFRHWDKVLSAWFNQTAWRLIWDVFTCIFFFCISTGNIHLTYWAMRESKCCWIGWERKYRVNGTKLVLSSWLYLVLWKYYRGWIKNLLEMWIVIPLTLIERKIELLENRSLSILPSCLLIFSCEFNLRLQWTWETGEKWMVVYIFFCHRLSEITSIRITLHWKQVHNPYKPNPTITQLIVRLRGEKIQQIQG